MIAHQGGPCPITVDTTTMWAVDWIFPELGLKSVATTYMFHQWKDAASSEAILQLTRKYFLDIQSTVQRSKVHSFFIVDVTL
jgi:hypothetical protein